VTELILFAILGGGAGAVILGVLFVISQFLFVCRPNEILIFSGRSYRLEDGSTVGYRVVHGGVALRVPFFEKVDRMDLTTIPIEINVKNAYSKGGIPLEIRAVAYVKVSSKGAIVNNAIERFLGRDPKEIRQVAKESLEGHLRGVLARMTPEEVNEDRLKFADEMVEETGDDLDRLGITLDAIKVQSVSDDVSYLDSIGRERLANVLSSAEISESTARADAEEAQANSTRSGRVADEAAEMQIKQAENQLRGTIAEIEARAKAAEERAAQGALAARARAEQTLQEIRTKLEQLRLMADVVLPAEAQRKAAAMKARADAAPVAADGEAMAEALRMLTEAWISAGADAKEIFLIQQLETIIRTVSDEVRAIEVGEIILLDNGDGRALANQLAARPAAVAAILHELRNTIGIDITGVLAGRSASTPALTAREA
jgi:flotillin